MKDLWHKTEKEQEKQPTKETPTELKTENSDNKKTQLAFEFVQWLQNNPTEYLSYADFVEIKTTLANNPEKYKNSSEIRDYWAEKKREERARADKETKPTINEIEKWRSDFILPDSPLIKKLEIIHPIHPKPYERTNAITRIRLVATKFHCKNLL